MFGGAAGFIVPFMFVYGPGLLLIGKPMDIAVAIPTAIAGSIFLAAGLMGHLFKPAAWWERALLLVAALALIDPGITTDLVGVACFLVVAASQYVRKPAAVARPEGATGR